jgi:hypothetical protein
VNSVRNAELLPQWGNPNVAAGFNPPDKHGKYGIMMRLGTKQHQYVMIIRCVKTHRYFGIATLGQ